jgi:hypothetical protein
MEADMQVVELFKSENKIVDKSKEPMVYRLFFVG